MKRYFTDIYENAPQRNFENVSDLDPLGYNKKKFPSEFFVTLSSSL